MGQPVLFLPAMPLRQGQTATISCSSAPSKPASNLVLYRDEQILADEPNLMIIYELDTSSKKNITKIFYKIDDPDSTWDNVLIRCEQIYKYANNYQKDIIRRIHTHCK